MALLESLARWLGLSDTNPRPEPEQRLRRPALEGMEDRLLLSAAPVLSGDWFVQSNGGMATISQDGNQLTLTNENGTQTTGQWVSATSFQAWGQTADVVQNGSITQILWNGNTWTQSAWQNGGLGGTWFVQSSGMKALIVQTAGQLVLTNEYGSQTVGTWISPTSFQAWGYTGQVVQNGALTQILWDGNAWTQSAWQNSGLSGQWFVQSGGQSATIDQAGGQLLLTNEQGVQTVGQWLSPTSFQAWGETAQVVQNGTSTEIVWNGNVWTQSTWQTGGLSGQWFVGSSGQSATISESNGQLLLTNEQGTQSAGQWVSPTSFQAFGQTAQVTRTGALTQIQWNGNTWTQSTWQEGGLSGQWFVQSNGLIANIDQTGGQLVLTNEQGTQTVGQWVSPTSFQAWGQTAQIVQAGATAQIQWDGNTWSQSSWQDGGLTGAWFVQSNGQFASITQSGGQLMLTNELGTQTVGQWLSPTTFQAWGQTVQIVSNGFATQLLWNGNSWTHSAFQAGGLVGEWTVQSNGQAANIAQVGGQLLLTNENGSQTAAQWVGPTTFEAWGQLAQIVQNGTDTHILWNGNVWTYKPA
jgi:hypothetical protein